MGCPYASSSPEPEATPQSTDELHINRDVDMDTIEPAATRASDLCSQLADGPIGFLATKEPITSAQQLPESTPLLALLTEPLASFIPQTANNKALHAALLQWMDIAHRQAEERENERIILVLQEEYVDRVRSQLVDKELKKKTTRQRLMGDCLPRPLTGDDFFARVQAHEKRLREEASEMNRVRARGADAYKAAMAEYESLSRERDALNATIKTAHAKSVARMGG